ncbi:hypothetical protein [Arthrobacter sp. NPDC092385]|uniref:hypothetical protein n=1 Tax=Arthrobacter sp. NPDC092385 TaxID=3363943 RepID=UPI0038050FDE
MGKKRDEIGQQVQHRVAIAKIRVRGAKEIAVAVAPLLGDPKLAPIVLSPKVNEVTERAVMWGAGFGHAGTGAWIRDLHGVARIDSTLARLGLGTLANGGWGKAGGLKVVAAAGTTVSAAIIGTWLVNGAIDMRTKLQAEKESAQAGMVLCGQCNGVLPRSAADGEGAVCPHCRHIADKQI